MTPFERLLGHDEAAPRELLEPCLPLNEAELDREFDAGWGDLKGWEMLTHG